MNSRIYRKIKTSLSIYLPMFLLILINGSKIVKNHNHQSNRLPYTLDEIDTNWIFQQKFSDEFNEKQLDTNKWNNHVKSWGYWSWSPENAYLDTGYLIIKMQYKEHERNQKKLYYTSGIIKSRLTIKYGFFEARIKGAERFPGVCPAFWVYNHEADMWTEIDFAELTQHSENKHRIDLSGHIWIHSKLKSNKPLHKGMHLFVPWDPTSNFHIYGCEWDTKKILWYIDGRLVDSLKNEYWNQNLNITFSMGLRKPLIKSPSKEGFPTDMKVDYIRVWEKSH